MVTVKEIYDELDRLAPFSLQESYDNSGILVGSGCEEVKKVLVSLDITKDAAKEAVENGYDLVISHHPVIFHGLKRLEKDNPAVILASAGVSAICMHTNFDSAQGGMNDILCRRLGLEPLEPLAVEHGVPIGYVCEMKSQCSPKELAASVKLNLGETVIRYNDTGKPLKGVAVCSGSGGGFLSDVIDKNIDAYITGDVKHDVFVEAHNRGICIIDAGHFHTENIFFDWLCSKLTEKFPSLNISNAKENKDILSYEI